MRERGKQRDRPRSYLEGLIWSSRRNNVLIQYSVKPDIFLALVTSVVKYFVTITGHGKEIEKRIQEKRQINSEYEKESEWEKVRGRGKQRDKPRFYLEGLIWSSRRYNVLIPVIPIRQDTLLNKSFICCGSLHGLLKKFWPLEIYCVLRTASSSLILNYATA